MDEMNKVDTQLKAPSKGKKVVKTILNTIINVLIVLVLIVSLLIAVMALTSKSSGISTIFGYTIQPIQSDSMKGGSPDGYGGAEYEKGDLMIAKATNYDSTAVYDKGDIVTFRSEDSAGQVMLISHRIINIETNGSGEKLYQTQGDNREMAQVPDQQSVSSYLTAGDIGSVYYTSSYEGKIIKGLGSVIDYLQSQQGFFFVVLLPMIIFFMYELVRVVLNATNYRKSKAEEDKKAAVDAAVAAALAAKDAEDQPQAEEKPDASSDEAKTDENPTEQVDMTPEQLEQFKQFMEFQKMQNAAKESQTTPEE